MDLLHAASTSIATSSAYRDDDVQLDALVDGSLETAWNSRTGDLTGAWIEVRVPDDATVTSIGMTAGFTHVSARADLFVGNHRVTRVRVLHDGTEVGSYPLDPELRTIQSLPVSGGGGVYRIELAALLPGSRTDWQEACVSELVVMGHAPGAVAGAVVPARAVGTLPPLPAPGTNAAPAGESDGVYFAAGDVGFVHLDARGDWDVLVRDAWNAPQPTADGGWLVRDMGRIHREGREPIGGPVGVALADVAAAADGTLWATAAGGFAHWDGSAWAVTAHAGAGPFFSQVVVDHEGTVWLATTAHGLFRLRDGAPEHVDVPGVTSIRDLRLDHEGRLVVMHPAGIVARRGDAWASLATGELWGCAFRRDGAMAAVGAEGLMIAVPEGAPLRPLPLAPLSVPDGTVRGAGWDGSGRLWVDTSVGLVVLEPALDRVARRYPPGTIIELAGHSGISEIFGIGSAPVLPPASAPVGHVHGRITRAGAPVSGAWIELCEHPDPHFDPIDGGPCNPGENPDLPGARTGADGTFEMYDVPDADLDVTIFVEGSPWVIREADCCEAPEQSQDLGTIEIP